MSRTRHDAGCLGEWDHDGPCWTEEPEQEPEPFPDPPFEDDWPRPVPQMDWESIVGVHPYRAMPDGTPCWCESQDAPHVGWVHAPFCLDKRVVAWLALRHAPEGGE